jgi:hypothetical protein
MSVRARVVRDSEKPIVGVAAIPLYNPIRVRAAASAADLEPNDRINDGNAST